MKDKVGFDPPTVGVWNVERDYYHADTQCISSGGLAKFTRSVPEYHASYILGHRGEETAEMQLGTLVHLAVLEPERFMETVVVSPKFDRRTKIGKQDHATFELANRGKLRVSQDDFYLAMKMAKAVLECDAIKDAEGRCLFTLPGPTEQPIRWQDPRTGLWCRCLPDKRRPGLVVDLKTTADPTPEGFARSVRRYGYDLQEAFYTRGCEVAFGEAFEFVFVAVGSQYPHEVVTHCLDAEYRDDARLRIDAAMDEMRQRIETNDWRSRYQGVQTVPMPWRARA